MATSPKGKKPAPRKTPPKQQAKPAARNKAAGSAAPARKTPATKKVPTKATKPSIESAPPVEDKATTAPLTDKQQRFVEEYMVDLNATQAAIRAGYSLETAGSIGHENLKKPEIQTALAAARKAQQERTGVNADRVVLEAWNVLTADARELVELKTGCCRCCWGEGFKFQRTLGEYNHDREQWLAKGKELSEFDDQGGIGFSPLKQPHPECPNCGGDGHARVVLKDSRHYSPQAKALYAGAKEGKYGIEVQMHDKGAAMEKLFKHLGLYERDNQQKTDPLASLLARVASGNGNGFAPVQNDPERPNSAMPVRQDEQDEEDEG